MGEIFTQPDKNTRMLAYGAMLYLVAELSRGTNRKAWGIYKPVDELMDWPSGTTSNLHSRGNTSLERADALIKTAIEMGGNHRVFMQLVHDHTPLPKMIKRPRASTIKKFDKAKSVAVVHHTEPYRNEAEERQLAKDVADVEPEAKGYIPRQEGEAKYVPDEGRPVGPLEYIYDTLNDAAHASISMLRRLEDAERITKDSNPLMHQSLTALFEKAYEIEQMLAPYRREERF